MGPATFLRLPNTKRFENFFNVDQDFIFVEKNNPANEPFYNEFFSRFTDDDDPIDDRNFLDERNWPIAIRINGGPVFPDPPRTNTAGGS